MKLNTKISPPRIEIEEIALLCDYPNAYIDDGDVSKTLSGLLNCHSPIFGTTLIFDTISKRYLYGRMNPYSYVLGEDTPVLQGGTCQNF